MMDIDMSPNALAEAEDAQWFEAAVAEYRESTAQIEGLGLRMLGNGLKGLIWGLRVYVLLMIIVVSVNVVQTLH